MHLTQPTLLLNVPQAQTNIGRMVAKTAAEGVAFRPHFKTHQSAAVGQWFRAHGVTRITVSSLRMATYFADAGWDDITVAIPVNVREMETINALAQRVKLGLLVEHPTTAAHLVRHITHPVQVWVEVDTGYGRTGLAHDDLPLLGHCIQTIIEAPHLHWAGLLTHAGHSYRAQSHAELVAVQQQTIGRMQAVQQFALGRGWGRGAISVGDTPTAVACTGWQGVDELRPGNFVFFDWMQAQIGVCSPADIAVAVACPIIATYPQRGQVVVHGGAIHLGKEALVEENGRVVYGYLSLTPFGEVYPTAALTSLSQEHGTLTITDPALWPHLQVGQMVYIVPVHSCLTADLYDTYLGTDGTRYGRLPRQL